MEKQGSVLKYEDEDENVDWSKASKSVEAFACPPVKTALIRRPTQLISFRAPILPEKPLVKKPSVSCATLMDPRPFRMRYTGLILVFRVWSRSNLCSCRLEI